MIAVDGSKITIQPKHEDLKDDPLDFQASELKKYFRQVTKSTKGRLQVVLKEGYKMYSR